RNHCRWARRYCRRLGMWQMDGASQLLSAHRRAGQFRVDGGGDYAALCFCSNHRCELRCPVSARCARIWILPGWGAGFGLFWWFLGPLTILPIWQGNRLDWSYNRASALFGSLIGHIIYGVIVGLIYASLDKLWVGFFKNSDPINREPEGAGSRFLYSLKWGAVASLAGGFLFSLVMMAIGLLPKVAGLVGGRSL